MPKTYQTREEMDEAVAKLQEERRRMEIEFVKLYGEKPVYLPRQTSTHPLTRDEMETALRSVQAERQRQDEESLRLAAEGQRLTRERERLERDSRQSWGGFSGWFGQKVSSSTPSRDADSEKWLESGKFRPPG